MHTHPPLDWRPDPEASHVGILIHGRGRDPEEMQGLAAALGLPGLRWLFPRADDATWYPQSFLAPIEKNEPRLSAAIAHIEGLVAGLLAEGVPADRILLGGFSQGACLAAEVLARHPRRLAGALLFTGGLIGPPGTAWPVRPVLAGLPVYLTTSEIDEWVPPARVRETEAWLEASGAAVTTRIFVDRPHTVAEEELAGAQALMRPVLAR
jgi:phospholipase/carboxylesterase